MRIFKAAAAALLLAMLAGAAQAQTVKYLNQLSGAATVAGTNTLPLCQVSGGCGSGNPLVNATISQLNTYFQGQVAATNRITTGTTNTLSAISAPFTTEIWVSATAGAKTDTVPECTSGLNGDVLIEVDEEGNAGTVSGGVLQSITISVSQTPTAGGTIGQAGTPAPGTSYAITANGGAVTFQCDGAATQWVLKGTAGAGALPNYQTGTSYPIIASDNGRVVDLNNAGAIAVSLPQAGTAGFPEGGFSVLLRASGAGTVTVTPTTSTINGAASATISGGNALWLFADGAGNYEGVPIAGSSGGSGSGGLSITPIIGDWYWPFIGEGYTTGLAQASGRIVCTLGVMLFPAHIEGITIYIDTVGTSTDDVALAVYAVGTDGWPNGTPVFTAAGQAEGSSAGALAFTGLSGVLSAKNYYFCRQSNDAAVVLASTTASPGASYASTALVGQPGGSSIFLSPTSGIYASGTYGTWPSFSGPTGWTAIADGPAMTLQVSSSP